MSVWVVNGAQWGDEGKGKIADMLARHFNLAARATGGDNAGHRIVVDGQEYKMRLTPSPIIAGTRSIIGDDVLVNPLTLHSEITLLEARRHDVGGRLTVSPNSHIVLPFHLYLDEMNEGDAATSIGSTKRGIGPAVADRDNRVGLRMEELISPGLVMGRLEALTERANRLIATFGGSERFDPRVILEQYGPAIDAIRPLVSPTAPKIHAALAAGQSVLVEGAQGVMLDLAFGAYPNVTSSHTTAAGLIAGLGIGPRHVREVIGVMKPYQTRVGKGPLVGEISGSEMADIICDRGFEYGTVTKRKRRIVPLDLVALHHAANLNGTTSFAMTKADVLDTLAEIPAITGYKINGKLCHEFPSVMRFPEVEPVYEIFEGWRTDISGIRDHKALPRQLQTLVERVERHTDMPVSIISVGAERDATIVRRPELVFPR